MTDVFSVVSFLLNDAFTVYSPSSEVTDVFSVVSFLLNDAFTVYSPSSEVTDVFTVVSSLADTARLLLVSSLPVLPVRSWREA